MRRLVSVLGPALVVAGLDTNIHNRRGTSFLSGKFQVANNPQMVCSRVRLETIKIDVFR